jgi:hypothetical protein
MLFSAAGFARRERGLCGRRKLPQQVFVTLMNLELNRAVTLHGFYYIPRSELALKQALGQGILDQTLNRTA